MPRTSSRRPTHRPHSVGIAYAANLRGDGLAYAAVSGEAAPRRIPFEVERKPALQGREVGYAALIAVTTALLDEGFRNVTLCVEDEHLALDLEQRRPLPMTLQLLYVQLKCRLNAFARADVALAPVDRDLGMRARAEVELTAAA